MLKHSISLLCAAMLMPGSPWGLNGRIGHETGDAAAGKGAASDILGIAHTAPEWRYRVLARRDEFAGDRTLLNAAALVSGGLNVGSHSLYLGLGTHFYRDQPDKSAGQTGDFYPAGGFHWLHHRFSIEILGSEKLTRAEVAFLFPLLIPIEIASSFEYLESQPYRWSAEIFAYALPYGGLIAGFEPSAFAVRAGLWLMPLENIFLRGLSRINLTGQTYFEFSVAYVWSEKQDQSPAPAFRAEESQAVPVKPKAEAKLPAFATLVKWGLTPVVALRLAREKNICALDQGSQTILARHHWECRNAK